MAIFCSGISQCGTVLQWYPPHYWRRIRQQAHEAAEPHPQTTFRGVTLRHPSPSGSLFNSPLLLPDQLYPMRKLQDIAYQSKGAETDLRAGSTSSPQEDNSQHQSSKLHIKGPTQPQDKATLMQKCCLANSSKLAQQLRNVLVG